MLTWQGYEISRMTLKDGVRINKKFNIFRNNKRLAGDLSPIEITPVHLDHSVPYARKRPRRPPFAQGDARRGPA
jgi:hypothetical protein